MLSRILHLLAAALIILGSAGALYLSNQTFFLAQGSDGTIQVLAPAVFGQVVGWIVMTFVIAYTVATPVFHGLWRSALLMVGVVFLLLASHRVVTDFKHGQVRDVWFLRTVQELSFDEAQPPAQSIQSFETNVVTFVNSRDGTLYLIPGFFPLNLAVNVLQAQWRAKK